MRQKKHDVVHPVSEPNKRRLAGFFDIDQSLRMEKCCRKKLAMDMPVINFNQSDLQVILLVIGNMAAGDLYCRLIPLVLLLVDAQLMFLTLDGNSISLFGRKLSKGILSLHYLVFLLYRFYHYPDTSRLRLSQVADNYYRADLKKAALAKLSVVHSSLKVSKSGVKKKNRQAIKLGN